MTTLVNQSCLHTLIDFPRSGFQDEQLEFFEQHGQQIEDCLHCPTCSMEMHKRMQDCIKKGMRTLLSEEKSFYMVSTRHNLSTTDEKTHFLSQRGIELSSSLIKLGDGGYYNYPDPAGSCIQAYSITQDMLRICEQLVFNHPLQRHCSLKEGCDAKAEHACRLLLDTGLTDDQVFKIYYIPKKNGIHVETLHGKTSWGHHVAAAIKDEMGQIYIFDSSFNHTRSLMLDAWLHILSDSNETLPLHASKDLNNLYRDDHCDYLIRVSFNEAFFWLENRATILPFNTEDTNALTFAPLKRLHLRKILKTHPLTALIASPYTQLLKPTFHQQKNLVSEAELHHACALEKLKKSIILKRCFMTAADIAHIEPCFLKTEQEFLEIKSNFIAVTELVENNLKIKEEISNKNKELQCVNDKALLEREYILKTRESYSKWIYRLENKEGVVTLSDRNLLEAIKEKFDKLTIIPQGSSYGNIS